MKDSTKCQIWTIINFLLFTFSVFDGFHVLVVIYIFVMTGISAISTYKVTLHEKEARK